jgi:ataxin-10
MLCTPPIGTRICISLLDRMVTLFDAPEPSDGAKAFDIGYASSTRLKALLFTQTITRLDTICSLVFSPEDWRPIYILNYLCEFVSIKIQLGALCQRRSSSTDEIIAPHQTILLKLLDSYLQSSKEATIHRQLCRMLSETFFELTAYAQQAIRRALGANASDGPSSGFSGIVNVEVASEVTMPPRDLDLFLPKVCEALVLVTQCIVTITLVEEEGDGDASMWVDNQVHELKSFFNEARSHGGDGLIESILGLSIFSVVSPA